MIKNRCKYCGKFTDYNSIYYVQFYNPIHNKNYVKPEFQCSKCLFKSWCKTGIDDITKKALLNNGKIMFA